MTNKDGSGSIAIKMIHTDTTWTLTTDVIRLIFSICLLIFSTVSVVYAISVHGTTMPFPAWAQFVCLGISLFILGVLEGLQIAVVELAHKDPANYAKVYPRAAKLLAFENTGRNVERFLMGRQVLVVFTVFVAARITTFNIFWETVPEAMIHTLMFSGFLGVILVVIVAQLTPQVLAAAYPAEFLNLPGMPIAFWACLIVEASGIAHAVWFLCVVVRKIFYNCLCGKHEKEMLKYDGMQRVDSKSPATMSKEVGEMNINKNDLNLDIKVTNEMLHTAEQVEETIEEQVELQSIKKKQSTDKYGFNYNDVFHADNEEDVGDELNTLISDVGNKRDLFYIYGDKKFFSPSQCHDKFKKAGLEPPNFLLPPDHKDHIPPHVIAMTLLKMYTEKCANEQKK